MLDDKTFEAVVAAVPVSSIDLARIAEFALPVGDQQHSVLRWWPIAQALASPDVHHFSQDYLAGVA